MNQISFWVLFISLFLFIQTTKSDEEEAKTSLLNFYIKLSNTNNPPDPVLGWNSSSYPCKDHWNGVSCNNRTLSVRKIHLDGLNFAGTFDASTLCDAPSLVASLTSLSLNDNHLGGENLDRIENCKQLTQFHIGGNRFSGTLPESLSGLNNLKSLNLSRNNFSGNLPELDRISGLQQLFVQYNQFTGLIPNFNFPNFLEFNVSFNNFTGPIPNGGSLFPASSFAGNPELCGNPLPNQCPKKPNRHQFLIYSGYCVIGLTVLVVIILKICKRNKKKEEKVIDGGANRVTSIDDSLYTKSIVNSGEYKTGSLEKSEISANSGGGGGIDSSSLIVLTSPEVNGLKFDDLLKAPAELVGRGRQGTVYKVVCENGMSLVVKRIRNWSILGNEFKQRMRRLDQVKHPNVLSAVAFYSSEQEKLLVYQYQQNGSLFKLLNGTQALDWSSRLWIAATITNALAFMHQDLHQDGIPHGNLKSSNILLYNNMEPCISEYGLMQMNNEAQSSLANFNTNAFKADIYGLGVILLELLTGKMVQTNGLDLAKWVLSVVREEWTVEVFDKTLIEEGASEERMLNLLQIAVKCVNRSPEARPSVNQVAYMINAIKEEEERSIVSEP
ncbi:probable inactive receptor kinase At2g26730 [Camellia sinensis]|uniref:Protein kinase domain-containing protein n=1 Tax=Camellia sinensis var. sinensis TaxID=542762 RepID=A0A4V3WKS5_CAMSN|nr:probable inactive receptor kinase At2g26730 [Camellia sinensis]XP_028094484.1 probable inactive receptor kinase At2g26730 [Camellia sinensis]THG02017.1 hypothetical protein TEA_003897 [Camellia sinensis var. sinensis]